jgi:hypothetical protein
MQNEAKLLRRKRLFRKLRSDALDILTGDHPNAIWIQMAHMIMDEVWFKAVIRVRERVGQPPVNAHLWNAFLTGYGVKQSLVIRRLTDERDGTASLLAIVKKFKDNAELLTREVVVGFDSTPMDVGALFSQMANSVAHEDDGGDGPANCGTTQRWSDADHTHNAFDRLRDAEPGSLRSPSDRVSNLVFDRLLAALKSDAIKRVRHQCDKYLAHADLSDLSNGLTTPTYNDIHASVKTLVAIKQFLCADFFNHSGGPVVPINQGNEFQDLSVPLVPPMPIDIYREDWRAVEEEVEQWGNASQFRQFAIHPSVSL